MSLLYKVTVVSHEFDAQKDAAFMAECLRLAGRGKGYVSPNPLVGAVLVKGNRILARGYHRQFGHPHAEVECLRHYNGSTKHVTLYVSLEPCIHHGKTPPCADLILQRGIPRVVVAMKDPNPLVRGRGIRMLTGAGVDVRVGVMQDEANHQNRFFRKHITSHMPYVHVKIAQTLDGRIAPADGRHLWISSPESRKLVHTWRREYDAILVGAGTIRSDNPRLDVRLVKGRNPDIVILDGRLSVSPSAKVFHRKYARRAFVCVDRRVAQTKRRKVALLAACGVTVMQFDGQNHKLALESVLRELYRHDVGSILVEGGSHVFTDFLNDNLVDELSIFQSPILLGEGLPALRKTVNRSTFFPSSRSISSRRVGRDTLFQAQFH